MYDDPALFVDVHGAGGAQSSLRVRLRCAIAANKSGVLRKPFYFILSLCGFQLTHVGPVILRVGAEIINNGKPFTHFRSPL